MIHFSLYFLSISLFKKKNQAYLHLKVASNAFYLKNLLNSFVGI